MSSDPTSVLELTNREYKAGFVTDIESETIPPGLSEDVVRLISAKKKEPEWMLEWRLKSYRHWLTMKEPTWQNVHYPKIDYQAAVYYAAPKSRKDAPKSLDEVDPKLLETYEKLGIPLRERAKLAGVAVDAVFDSVSVATTFREQLSKVGIIFCSFSEAVQNHPDLVRQYLGSVVPHTDNFFAALNSAVFSDGSFAYIPKGVRCPMELSTYFRINAANTGPERTLIVAEEGSYQLPEGCTAHPGRGPAPRRGGRARGARNAEIRVLDRPELVSRRQGRQGGIHNFVTVRRLPPPPVQDLVDAGRDRLRHHVKYPLHPPGRLGRRVLPVAVTNNYQQADTGTKMIHIGKNTKSIVSRALRRHGQNTYRGMVDPGQADSARNCSQCDSL